MTNLKVPSDEDSEMDVKENLEEPIEFDTLDYELLQLNTDFEKFEKECAPFEEMRKEAMPDESELSSLSAKQLNQLKLTRNYQKFTKTASFNKLTFLIIFESKFDNLHQKFINTLLNKITNENDEMDLNIKMLKISTFLIKFPDFRASVFQFLLKVDKFTKGVFSLLTICTDQLTKTAPENEIHFLSSNLKQQILSGLNQKLCIQALLKLLSITKGKFRQNILLIMLLDVLDKCGDYSKNCLDNFLNLAKASLSQSEPSHLLAVCCMVKLLLKFTDLEYPNIYKDVFLLIGNTDLIDKNVKISLHFLETTKLILTSSHLPIFMKSKILRQLSILCNKTTKSEISSKILSILSAQQMLDSSNKAWTKLQYNKDFNYKSKNLFKIGGISTLYPELINSRYHIDPDIVLQAGAIITSIDICNEHDRVTNSTSIAHLDKLSQLEATTISVNFDDIDENKVDLLFGKEDLSSELIF